jgi:hypothetical protein
MGPLNLAKTKGPLYPTKNFHYFYVGTTFQANECPTGYKEPDETLPHTAEHPIVQALMAGTALRGRPLAAGAMRRDARFSI